MTNETVKGIPEAIVPYTFDRWGTPEQRQYIDLVKFFGAIQPYLPGLWAIVEKRVDDTNGRTRYIRIARDDGTEIDIYSTWADVETKVNVSSAKFYYTAERKHGGDDIPNSYLFGYGNKAPCLDVNVTKRNAKSIANHIMRSVIEPTSAVMPKVREIQASRAASDSANATAVAIASKIDGVEVREHYNDPGTRIVRIEGTHMSGTIRKGSTDVHFERLYLPIEALEDFVALAKKYKKAP